MEDIFSTSSTLNELVQELLKIDGEAVDGLVERIFSLLSNIPPLDLNQSEHKAVLPQIEQAAVSLWNYAVAKKTGGKLSNNNNAKVRHVAANLVFLSNTNTADGNTLRKELMMALKTARAWLDAKEPALAQGSLAKAVECIEKLRIKNSEDSSVLTTPELAKRTHELNKDLFKVHCYKAEMACHQDLYDEALTQIKQAKELLQSVPHECCYLSMLCYNFGVDCYQKHNCEATVDWLRVSYEIGNIKEAVGSKNQARTLRLLANAYLEWDSTQYYQKALNAIDLANAEHPHPAGLYLKVKVLLQGEIEDDRLRNAMNAILEHSDLTVDLGLSMIKLILQQGKKNLAYEAMVQLSDKFHNKPELLQVSLAHLELLLQNKERERAQQLIQEILKSHNSGSSLDPSTMKQLHLALWEQAAQLYMNNEHEDALKWYDNSLAFCSSVDDKDTDLAKLHRNRASCYVNMAKYDEAEKAIGDAERFGLPSAHMFYLKFKISLLQNKEEIAIEALKNMVECGALNEKNEPNNLREEDSDIHGFICLAAQLAFEHTNRDMCISVLEKLVELSPDPAATLTTLRCLTRLRLTFISEQDGQTEKRVEISAIRLYGETALNKLMLLSVSGKLEEAYLQNAAAWFLKIAWNMALQCKDSMQELYAFFMLCAKLTKLCPEDVTCLSRMKTCLLMSTAACLVQARESNDDTVKRELWQTALEHIELCRHIFDRLEEYRMSDSDPKPHDVTCPLLLVLYEFEARTKLGDPSAEKLLERAQCLHQSEPKTFETMSALAMEPPAKNRDLSIKAMHIAIKKHIKAETVDYEKCSTDFHTLIEQILQSKGISDDSSRKEAWSYFTDVIDFIDSRADGLYPQMEVLWLMTKVWNCAIHIFTKSQSSDALSWCELAMKLLKHIGSLKDNYEDQMAAVYEEISAKVIPGK